MSAPSIFQRAMQLHKSRRLTEAISLYREHLELGEDPAAEHDLGLALIQNRQLMKGLEHLRKAADAEPDNAMFWAKDRKSVV